MRLSAQKDAPTQFETEPEPRFDQRESCGQSIRCGEHTYTSDINCSRSDLIRQLLLVFIKSGLELEV